MFLPEGRSLAIHWHFRRRSGLTDKQMQAVAREMNMTQPTVSKLIAALEKRLAGKLFARSTRRLALTAEGQRFYEECRTIVDAVESAEASFKTGREEIAGVLHVATSVGFG